MRGIRGWNRRATSGRGLRRSVAKERLWRGHIRRQAASGLSIRAYCAGHALSEPSFYAWRSELARRDGAARARPASQPSHRRSGRRFVELTFDRAAPIPSPLGASVATTTECYAGLELVHPRGHVLRIGPASDRHMLAAVLALLEQPSC